jgi:cyclase
MAGYDCGLIERISTRVKVPVIASGGAGTLSHVRDVIYRGYADAVCLSSALHYNHLSVSQIKNSLRKTQ